MANSITRDHHNLRRNLKLNGNYISNDGGDEGISIQDDGDVIINGDTKLYLNDAGGEYLNSDGTDLTIASGNNINIDIDKNLTIDSDATINNALTVNCDSMVNASGIEVQIDDSKTSASSVKLLYADYNKSGVTANGDANQSKGLAIEMTDTANTNHSGSSVRMTGAQIDVGSASAVGSITQKGLVLNVAADGTGDAANTFGIEMEVMDGGTDIKMKSSADTGDYCTIATTANGATTIATVDDDGEGADLTLNIDGYVDINSASGEDITLDSGDDIILDADGDQVSMKFGGATGQIDFSNENSGDGIVRQMIDAKDLVIQQFDGNEVARFTDRGDLKITNTVYFAAETANTIGDGATGAIDWNVSQKQKLTITGTGITVNFTNPAGVCNLLLKVVQGDGSDVVGTWDSDIYWAGGSPPTLSTGNGDVDILSFYWDGSRYYGIASLDFS